MHTTDIDEYLIYVEFRIDAIMIYLSHEFMI